MNNDAQIVENAKRSEEYNQFIRDLINKFSPESYDELLKYTFYAESLNIPKVEYKKNWLFNQTDIGVDMLQEKYNINIKIKSNSVYIGIPLKQIAIIDFFEANKMTWVTTVKKI